ncbi:MAG: hypothetical protein CMP21_08120 [Rickettsiales bacterium]|nr:hypothetical protein [Rickettsiales bacterium]
MLSNNAQANQAHPPTLSDKSASDLDIQHKRSKQKNNAQAKQAHPPKLSDKSASDLDILRKRSKQKIQCASKASAPTYTERQERLRFGHTAQAKQAKNTMRKQSKRTLLN